MESVPAATRQPIPTPPDFPVTWETPEDGAIHWVHDRMHFPKAMTPLEHSVWAPIYNHGFNTAAATHELPVRVRSRRVNTYPYDATVPLMLSDEEMEAQGKRTEEKVRAAVRALPQNWNERYLPEIQRALEYWESFDLPGATNEQLLEHLDKTIALEKRMWEIHFLSVLPAYMAISPFEELYRDLFPEAGPFDAYRLLEGFSNKTLETSHALWRLSRKVMASPEVSRAVGSGSPDEVKATLRETEAGRAFLAELEEYLRVYGQRGDLWSLRDKSWIEDPSPVLKNLRDCMSRPDHDHGAELSHLAAERDRLVAEAREAIAGYPQPVREQFDGMLRAAQFGNVLSEDHNYWIDYCTMHQVRRVLLECGRRLAASGVTGDADDLWYLELDEVRAGLRGDSGDLRSRVEERKAEMERFREIPAPPAIGTMPPGPPPDNPVGRMIGKFFGTPPERSTDEAVITGHPGSSGAARGPARVMRSLAEAEQLQPGEILVAETTAPPWTPLFATAAAVVTDTGGVLSHCAVVAREYRIPAVVGTAIATARIHTGQMIEVDGDAGVVRLVG